MSFSECLLGVPKDATIDFEKYLSHKIGPIKKREEVCVDFQDGKCHKEECTFRHALVNDEMFLRKARKEVCKYWLRGLCCAGEDCLWLHEYDVDKIPPCIYVEKLGECGNPECIYQHPEENSRIPRCAAYDRGFCSFGPNCSLRHVKGMSCPSYLAGFCPFGPRCTLQHPKMVFFDEESVRERIRHDLAVSPGSPNLKVVCDRCRDPGHIAPQCPGKEEGKVFKALQQRQEPGAPPIREGCYYCGERDHVARTCPKRTDDFQKSNRVRSTRYQERSHFQRGGTEGRFPSDGNSNEMRYKEPGWGSNFRLQTTSVQENSR